VSEGVEPISLTDEQRLDWLRLIRSQNVGPRTFRALLNHYGGARAALAALPTLARRGGGATTPQICSRDDAAREIEAAAKLGIALVALGEADYPRRLQMIDDAPPLIAIRGEASVLALPLVAIVGSRNASAAGVKITQRPDARPVCGGICHRVRSRPRHRCRRASRQRRNRYGRGSCRWAGPCLSARADPKRQPRDQSIAARKISRARLPTERHISVSAAPVVRMSSRRSICVIVEAAKRSGSLITARLALEQGREVFAVPGSPLDPRAEGTNSLIKQGATPVTEADDIISVLRPIMGTDLGTEAREQDSEDEEKAQQADPEPDDRARIIALLSPTPVSIDDLIRLSRTSPRVVRMVLLELEIAGRIERHGGGLVSILLAFASSTACL
jgi:DNA processing protein